MNQPSLTCALVPWRAAIAWWKGQIDDPDLWRAAQPPGGPARCLFVYDLKGKESWKALALLIRALDPRGMVMHTRTPEIRKRAERYARPGAAYPDGAVRWITGGPKWQAFRASLSV